MNVFKAQSALFDSVCGEWVPVTIPQTVCVISIDGTLVPSSLRRTDGDGWSVTEDFWGETPSKRVFGEHVLVVDQNGCGWVPRSKGETRHQLVAKFLANRNK